MNFGTDCELYPQDQRRKCNLYCNHYYMGICSGQRYYRQYPIFRYNDSDHQKPCSGIRSRFIRSGMDTGTGHRYRWKCYPDRCICQRSWYRRCIKKRSSYFLETVLYLRDSGNTDRNCSINAIYHFQIYIIQNSELISDAKSGSALQTYTYLDFC